MLPETTGSSPGLRSALAILTRLAESQGLPFTKLRKEVGLPAATVSRLLKVMAEEGWVDGGGQDPWRPGSAFRAAAWRLAPSADVVAIIQPVVDSLADVSKESTAFVEWAGDGFVFRAKREMPESYHYLEVGQRNRGVLDHVFGLVCLAHTDQAAWRRFAGLAKRRNIDLESVLQTIVRSGDYTGQDKGHRVGHVVRAHNGAFLGCMGVTHIGTPLDDRQLAKLRAVVADHARQAATLINDHC